jgi:hypothetical protein
MTEMSRLRSASLDMTGLRLYCPPTYMGQGFKVYSSSELCRKWPKVAETMTEAATTSHEKWVSCGYLHNSPEQLVRESWLLNQQSA